MDRDPGDFADSTPPRPFADMTDEEQDAWLKSLPPPPGMGGDDDAAIARGRRDAAEGRAYPHALVGRWLKTVGKPDYKPFDAWLAEQDG